MTERKSDEQNVHNGPLTPELAQGGIGLVIPHIFDHMDIPRTMSSSRRIPFQITSFPGGLSFFLAR